MVVDTNKIIAALLREGRARRILFHPGLEILLPEYVLEEMRSTAARSQRGCQRRP